MRKLVPILFLVVSCFGYSQSKTDTLQPQKIEDTKELFSTNDTLFFKKADSLTLKVHKEATLIDSLWLNELIKSPLYDTIQYVLRDDELVIDELQELPTELLKERLEVLDNKTPFHIEYNKSLEQVIKTYLKRRKSAFSNLMERARYYFPMFEEQLDKYDIPLEMKYLAIVESALKPRARSRVGAKGLWQFMYQTGKQFDLNVSSYVDERSDPYRATEAACKYLSSLYKIFGDWDLALAAYNSGPGNVNKAIRRSGGSKNYWNIRHNLPRETAGYVPAFYATLYIFEYANEHNIKSKESALNYFETDTVQIKRQLTFEQIYETLNIDIEVLQYLNPQYKLDIIPFIKGKNYTLTLPVKDIGNFVSNEQQIYAYASAEEAKREKPLPEYVEMNDRILYRVKSGDYLGKIADRYGVSVSKIKQWNNMRSTRLRIGQRLTIYPRKLNVSVTSTSSKAPTKKAVPTGPFTTYTVKSGDSLWLIAKNFENVSLQDIKEWNNIWSVKSLKPGTKLKIFKK
ncbi:MAG: LysM peptidoglycan-binding domain-containing protein [Lutibacter sp.]|uniref:lytic transglycosylase domain-containing protein n=1 Tax=Lutibacter sp. TaxID=1925666 RepID=UPI0017AC747F|nr:lytic transglycosylase domain-containing protein [Lutibacter sp.]MBT8316341.1 LysM peptidoglycan-binding domain-containing protein [Lutibacter sp.]NNJ57201.1 LysM peptidoglycan-binding domain-containing protein [Lutibacter sp.]